MSSIEVVSDIEDGIDCSMLEGAKASLKVSKMRYEEAIKELEDAKTLYLDAKEQLQKSSVSGGSEPCKCSSLIQACEEEKSKLVKKISDLESLEIKLKEEVNEYKVKRQRLETENKSPEGELKECKVERIRMNTESMKSEECKETVEKELQESRSEPDQNVKQENISLIENGVGSSSAEYESFIISKGVKRGNPIVFFDMNLHEKSIGRIVIELYTDTAPRLAEIFRKLCVGEMIIPGTARRVGYKGTSFTYFSIHHYICGGNLRVNNASESNSIYGNISTAEKFSRPHTGIGDVFLCIINNTSLSRSFVVYYSASTRWKGHYAMIGRVIQGMEVLEDKINGIPNGYLLDGTLMIDECGQLF